MVDRGANWDDTVGADRAGLAEDTALHAGDVAGRGDARLLVRLHLGTAASRPRSRLRRTIALLREALFEAIERLEQQLDRTVVGLLRDRVTAAIDSVVDALQHQRIGGVNLRAKRLGVVVRRG